MITVDREMCTKRLTLESKPNFCLEDIKEYMIDIDIYIYTYMKEIT